MRASNSCSALSNHTLIGLWYGCDSSKIGSGTLQRSPGWYEVSVHARKTSSKPRAYLKLESKVIQDIFTGSPFRTEAHNKSLVGQIDRPVFRVVSCSPCVLHIRTKVNQHVHRPWVFHPFSVPSMTEGLLCSLTQEFGVGQSADIAVTEDRRTEAHGDHG
jgi:hypothetical protein